MLFNSWHKNCNCFLTVDQKFQALPKVDTKIANVFKSSWHKNCKCFLTADIKNCNCFASVDLVALKWKRKFNKGSKPPENLVLFFKNRFFFLGKLTSLTICDFGPHLFTFLTPQGSERFISYGRRCCQRSQHWNGWWTQQCRRFLIQFWIRAAHRDWWCRCRCLSVQPVHYWRPCCHYKQCKQQVISNSANEACIQASPRRHPPPLIGNCCIEKFQKLNKYYSIAYRSYVKPVQWTRST